MSLVKICRNSAFAMVQTAQARRPMPKLKQQTIFRRKEEKRLKSVNIFTPDYTNEKPHPYFTAKRIRAMGIHTEKSRNTHPLSAPIDPALKKVIAKTFAEDSHYAYWQYRNELLAAKEYREAIKENNIQTEMETMPTKILPDLKARSIVANVPPSYLRDEMLYYEQYELMLPNDEFEKIAFRAKLQKAYENYSIEIGEGEDE